MSAGAAIAIGCALLGALVLTVVVLTARASRRRLPAGAVGSSTPEYTVLGQMAWTSAKEPAGRATAPTARLSMFDWGVRLGPPIKVLALITPTLEFRFGEIQSADAVRPVLSSLVATGVRFRVPAADLIAVFWTNSRDAVIGRLTTHGVPVCRTETAIGFLKPFDT